MRAHNRSFGDTHVLRGIDLDIRPGEFVALLGRSGSGKSTLLRSLAGLDPAPAGEVEVHGTHRGRLPGAAAAALGRVRDNVALALLERPARGVALERADAALDEVGLGEKLDAWPLQLSGGQAQRVSLARALVSEPDLLLLDEPFSALDALTRIEMHRLVIELWERHALAVLLVTHDVDEALCSPTALLVLDEGRMAHSGRSPSPGPTGPRPTRDRHRSAAEVLDALGVQPTSVNPNRNPWKQGAA